MLTTNELERYDRQIMIKGGGEEGQERPKLRALWSFNRRRVENEHKDKYSFVYEAFYQ